MDTSLLAVATITWARTPFEEEQLCRSLERLADEHLPVAVADAGSDPDFTAFLSRLPGFEVAVPSERGLVAQVMASMSLAARFDTPFILYTESDKALFFERGLRTLIRRAQERRQGCDLGVALASRSPESFQTYPPMQRYTEGVINHLCGELIGSPGDCSYGPFVLTRALVPQLLTMRQHLGWGWRHFAFRAAHRLGLGVDHVIDEHRCPPDQRVEDDAERLHRLRQLSENILGLIEQP
jgi:hypothetical protein